MNTRRPLIWHLYPPYLLIILLALAAISLYISASLKTFHLDATRNQLETHAQLFRILFEENIASKYESFDKVMDEPALKIRFMAEVDHLCKTIGKPLATRLTVILASGVVIGDSNEDPQRMDNHGDRPEVRAALEAHVGTTTRYSYTLAETMMYVAIPVKHGDSVVGAVRASLPVPGIQQTLGGMYRRIALGGMIIVLFAGGVSLLIAYRLTRPLHAITRGIAQFTAGKLQHRIRISGSQEICIVADAMNRMAAQLDERIETITQQRNELEAVLSSMVEAVIVLDAEARIIKCNQAAGNLFQFSLKNAQNRLIHEVIRNADVQRFIHAAFSSATPVEEEIKLNSGSEQFLRAHGTLLQITTDHTVGALLVFHNITRLKQLENMRRDFVANVSHELKTPITSINGFVETLRDVALNDPDNAMKFLDIIAKNAHRLNSIIEDLLALSKIEQGEEKGQIVLLRENVNDVLKTAIIVCENAAQIRQIAITLDCPDQLFADMNGELMEQAVINLLDNAMKYSEPHSTIHVRAEETGAELRISVQDFGCGIPNEHLPRLFERFYRVDKARSRNLGGTGLGLAIVKHIVNAHHGSIEVESTPGTGSTFSIILPVG